MNKKVGIIGTGATSVQVVPEISKIVKELYVFQRTPSSIDVRDQRETTKEEIEEWKKEKGWAKARRERFSKISSGRTAIQANDDYLSGKIKEFKKRKKHNRKISFKEYIDKQLGKNFRIMEQIRSRVDETVENPIIAQALKPYYPYGCKRPAFHDEYLSVFNLPHINLIDTSPNGVEKINESGVIHNNKEYELDVLIYATGFNWMEAATFNTVIGKNKISLSEKARKEVAEIYKNDRSCYQKIKKALPKYIISDHLDKKFLLKAVLDSKNNLKKISKIVHPIVRTRMNKFLIKNSSKN